MLVFDEEAVSAICAGEAVRTGCGFGPCAGLDDCSRGILESGEKGLPDEKGFPDIAATEVREAVGSRAQCRREVTCEQRRAIAQAKQAKSAWVLSWTQTNGPMRLAASRNSREGQRNGSPGTDTVVSSMCSLASDIVGINISLQSGSEEIVSSLFDSLSGSCSWAMPKRETPPVKSHSIDRR